MATKDPILITGIPRSGTSIIAGAIKQGKVWTGWTDRMFENIPVRDNLVRPFLVKLGADPLCQYPLPELNDCLNLQTWRAQVMALVNRQGYQGGNWLYKGASVAVLWSIWHDAFPNAKWIVVRRKTSDIVNSCLKTWTMNVFTLEENQKKVGANSAGEAWLYWVHCYEDIFRTMLKEVNAKIVWPERMVDNDYEQMEEVFDWLDMRFDMVRVKSFIQPKLWKSWEAKYGKKESV